MAADARIVFLALGTRGDVQPLAVLAAGLQRKQPVVQTHLISHAEHQVPGSAVYARDVSTIWCDKSLT